MQRCRYFFKASAGNKFALLLICSFLVSGSQACKNNISKTVSVNGNSTAEQFQGTGVVTKINLELGSVELDHEEIKGLMPPMIMEFYVTKKSEIEVLKIGDKINFVLEKDRGQEKLISIKKIQ